MLDITKVLNRSWHILWKYRILWVFGFFLAMAAGGGGSGSALSIGPRMRTGEPAIGIGIQRAGGR